MNTLSHRLPQLHAALPTVPVRPLLLMLPLLIAALWGSYFDDHTYGLLHHAQDIAAGRSLGAWDIARQYPLQSPLFAALLALVSPLLDPTLSALALSAIGTAVLALLLYQTALNWHGRIAAASAGLLLALNPLLLGTLGRPDTFAVAAAIAALALLHQAVHENNGRIRFLPPLLLLLLALHFDPLTLAFTGSLLWFAYRRRQTHPRQILLVLLPALAWLLFAWWQFGRPFAALPPWQSAVALTTFIANHQLLWLLLPFVAAGLKATWERPPAKRLAVLVGLTFPLLAILTGSPLTAASLAAALSLLAALGLAHFATRTLAPPIRLSDPPPLPASPLLPLILLLPLLAAHLIVIWNLYQTRPLARAALEAEAAEWLAANSEPADTLFASLRLGYLAGRPLIPAPAHNPSDAEMARFMAVLIEHNPNYLVAAQTIAWSYLTATGWHEQLYQEAQRFPMPGEPTAPLIVWAYHPFPSDAAPYQPADVLLPNGVKLVGYRLSSRQIVPGEALSLTLYFQPTRPITVGLETAAHLAYVQDGWVWSWQRRQTPRTIPPRWWQPGQVIPERIRLDVGDNIPYGAFDLQLLWQWSNHDPATPLYQNGDTNPLDRIHLAHIAVPPPVTAPAATPVEATFGDQIRLAAYEVSGQAIPGSQLNVTLDWEAIAPPSTGFRVFVHLLDAAGQLVANHDGEPMDGRFSTAAWLPDFLVQDVHPLTLPPDLPPGDYQINVGLYDPLSGERLPVRAAAGDEPADRSLPLHPFTLRPQTP